ncbi:hypothetical protein V6N12_070809 [Hibiscus sabdariffa]|uniref:RNase H type-1 domain-containing protein n=1 Tax=Hibiscus sabdariffa TaxID=183260 RepID=A0ABR2FHZ4_9ROSI
MLQNPSIKEEALDFGMVAGQERGQPPEEVSEVDMVDVLERPDMNLEKMEGDMDARTALPAEIGGKWDEHRLGGFIVQREIARGAGKNMLASGLGELDVEDAEEAVNVDLVASNMRIVMVDVGLNSVNSRAESVAKERSKLRRGRCGRCLALRCTSDVIPRPTMVLDLLSSSGDWDWERLKGILPGSVLDTLAAVKPPRPQFGSYVLGWRWDERRRFTLASAYRCCELFDSDYVGRESVLDRGDRLIIECNRIFARNIVRPTLSGIGWKGPARGWVKVNVDTSVIAPDNRASIGGLICDDTGGWVLGFYRGVGCCSVFLAKMWAIHDGLRRAWDTGCRRVEVENDNKEAANIVNQVSLAFTGSALVQAIWSSMQQDWLVRVRYVPRETNEVADKLAAMGRGQSMEGRVLFVPYGPVATVVSEEQRQWLESLPARSDGSEDG